VYKDMTVVPWKCHLCGNEFDTLNGGLCKICNEPTCLACFVYKKSQKVRSIYQFKNQMCISCTAFKERCEKKGLTWPDEVQKLKEIKARISNIEKKALSMINKKSPSDDKA
jgi:hypothetical protein